MHHPKVTWPYNTRVVELDINVHCARNPKALIRYPDAAEILSYKTSNFHPINRVKEILSIKAANDLPLLMSSIDRTLRIKISICSEY